MTRPRLLAVDDEQHVLDALARMLRADFELTPALGGGPALATLTRDGPFDVVLSDMRMPGMHGITFLERASEVAPDTVRVLLTGQADVSSALDAVNRCSIFRFLLKPIDHDDLVRALHAACEQHRLLVAERELLEHTLRGAVAALLDALSLANPVAFARANRVRRIVSALLPAADAPDGWSIEVAAALAHVGAVALPAEVASKLDQGLSLRPEEHALVKRVPELSEQLLAAIPRLEPVREAIRMQAIPYNSRERIPLGARLLKIANDLDRLESSGFERNEAVAMMARSTGEYDPALIEALRTLASGAHDGEPPRAVTPAQLAPGMILARDVTDGQGLLLVGRGHEVTPSLIARLTNLGDRIATPIFVTGDRRTDVRLADARV